MKRKSLINKLDKIISLIVRSAEKCEACLQEKEMAALNPHHFYSRSNQAIRWDFDNLFCLCSGCHILSSKFSAHKTPADFVEWAIQKRGRKWYRRVQKKAHQFKQFSDQELIDLHTKLKQKLTS